MIEIQVFEGDGINPFYKGFLFSDGSGNGYSGFFYSGDGVGYCLGAGMTLGDGYGKGENGCLNGAGDGYGEIDGQGDGNEGRYGDGYGHGSSSERIPGVQS